ncbi:MAG: hypothetical protein JWR20_1154 [Marmoricola sp.]|jgi:hypothetical protein|nr:hypothetical protein [Marmoricola sp.]
MQGHTKVVLITLTAIFLALGAMLAISLVIGDKSHTDTNNNDVDSNLGTPTARPSSENGSGR